MCAISPICFGSKRGYNRPFTTRMNDGISKDDSNFWVWMKSYGVAIQMKPLSQYFMTWCYLFFSILQKKFGIFVEIWLWPLLAVSGLSRLSVFAWPVADMILHLYWICFITLWNGCRLRAVSLFSWSVEQNTRDTQITTRVTKGARRKRLDIIFLFLLGLPPSFLASRGSAAQRSRARALLLQRDCSQSRTNVSVTITSPNGF